jgi:hypothetical protein
MRSVSRCRVARQDDGRGGMQAALWRAAGRVSSRGPGPAFLSPSASRPVPKPSLFLLSLDIMAAGAGSGTHGQKPLTPRQAFMKNWFAMEVRASRCRGPS